MKNRTFPLVSLVLFVLSLLPLPVRAEGQGPGENQNTTVSTTTTQGQQPATDPLAALRDTFNPEKNKNASENANKLSEKLLEASGAVFPGEKEGQEQRGRVLSALSEWVMASPEDAARLYMALQSSQLAPEDKAWVLSFIKQQAGEKDRNANLKNLTQLTDFSKKLQAKIDLKTQFGSKEALDKFFDNIGVRYGPEGPMATLPQTLTPKKPVIKEGEFLAGSGVQDLYERGAMVVTVNGRRLSIQFRGNADDPKGLYANLTDITNTRDVRGHTFQLITDTEGTFTLLDRTYAVSVKADKIKDPDAPGGLRDDLVVKILAVDEKKKKEVSVTDETITVYGREGLLARRIKDLYEGKPDADGNSYRPVVYLGEGNNRKKFYAAVQGGVNATVLYYPADQVDNAYDAIMNRKTLQDGDLKPSHVINFASGKNGDAIPYSDGSAVFRYGGQAYQYVYSEIDKAVVLKNLTPAEAEAIEKKKEQARPGKDGAGDEEKPARPGEGAKGDLPDPDWPDKIEGPVKGRYYIAIQAKVNAEIKKLGADYRIYVAGMEALTQAIKEAQDAGDAKAVADLDKFRKDGTFDNDRHYVIKAGEKGKVVPSTVMDKLKMDIPAAADTVLRVSDSALQAESETFACFFDLKNPMKKLGLAVREGLPDPDTGEPAEKGYQSLNVTDLGVLAPALEALGFSKEDAAQIRRKADFELSNGGQFVNVQGTKTTAGHQIQLVVRNPSRRPIIWPLDGKAPEDGTDQPKKKKSDQIKTDENAEGDAPAFGNDRLYVLNDNKVTVIQGKLEETVEVAVEGGKKTLRRDWLSSSGWGIYRDKSKRPLNNKDANWYISWVVYQAKEGKALATAQFPQDFVDTGYVTPPVKFSYEKQIYHPLTIGNEQSMANLSLYMRVCPIHPNAYAVFLQPYDPNSKYEGFAGHVIYKEKDPGRKGHSDK